MYSMMNRVRGGVELMCESMGNYLKSQGRALVNDDDGKTGISFIQVRPKAILTLIFHFQGFCQTYFCSSVILF